MSNVSSQTALTNTVVNVTTRSSQLVGFNIGNPNAAVSYVQFFNQLAANVVLGTTTPFMVIAIAANGSTSIVFAHPAMTQSYPAAMSVAATTTPTGSTAPASAVTAAIFYM